MSRCCETTVTTTTGRSARERVLITGGAAGIGAATAARCRDEGWEPVVIDRAVDGSPGASWKVSGKGQKPSRE